MPGSQGPGILVYGPLEILPDTGRMWRHVFKNRWIALAWVGLICWQAYDFASPKREADTSQASPEDQAALQKLMSS